jgi:DNA-directed RNA polymerase subunit RPC12/RpoP
VDDPIYLCLDCTRGRIADPLFNSFDVGIGVSRNDGVNYGCGDCGRELPESKRRELKVENLLLRARLAEIVAQVDEIDELSAARFKAEEIADEAITLAHQMYVKVQDSIETAATLAATWRDHIAIARAFLDPLTVAPGESK